jgi:dolichol-phosphate mannosyltransferase
MEKPMSVLISFVVPVLNEVGNLEAVCTRVESVMATYEGKFDFEILFMDNHSDDGTYDELIRLSVARPNLRAIRFSRNVGYQLSILTGLLAVRGVAAIQLDADLEDPPELVPEFIKQWEKGAKVVYGVRKARQESVVKTMLRKTFYRLLQRVSKDNLPLDAGDFRLIDRCLLDQLVRIKDQKPYLRGIISSFGYEQVGIPYERDERKWGKSKFQYRAMTSLAIDGLLNHSDLPLKLATRVSILIATISFIVGVGYLIGKLVFLQQWAAGFATTTILILLSLGIISFLLGIIGEYLGRIYVQLRGYPGVIVEKEIDKKIRIGE